MVGGAGTAAAAARDAGGGGSSGFAGCTQSLADAGTGVSVHLTFALTPACGSVCDFLGSGSSTGSTIGSLNDLFSGSSDTVSLERYRRRHKGTAKFLRTRACRFCSNAVLKANGLL